jgi:hypothetical protein
MEAPGTSLMNLNAVSEHELTQLPRVGVDKARRIVHYRAIRKGFRDWDDFAGTPGIAEADVEAIRSRAWIGPPIEDVRSGTTRRRTARGPATVRRPRQMIS